MVPEERAKHIQALKTVCHSPDVAEIAVAIEYCQLLLAESPPRNNFTYFPADTLGKVLLYAFKCTDNIEYLNKSIAACRDMLGMANKRWPHFHVIGRLCHALSVHWNLFKDGKDFDELIQLYSISSKDPYTKVPDQLELLYVWAENAQHHGHHTTPTAYETALSLMEDTVLFAPTLETQHLHLVSKCYVHKELPQNVASFEVSRG